MCRIVSGSELTCVPSENRRIPYVPLRNSTDVTFDVVVTGIWCLSDELSRRLPQAGEIAVLW
ncbi:MAG: hypothetical protein KDA89_18980 [Planctomycetaceae bacterium]|nr:hypothetical protein [Planctomycetaceae bacterium]